MGVGGTKEVFVLRELECIKAIANPKKIDILKRLKKRATISKSCIVEKYYYPSAKNIVIGNDILDFTLKK